MQAHFQREDYFNTEPGNSLGAETCAVPEAVFCFTENAILGERIKNYRTRQKIL